MYILSTQPIVLYLGLFKKLRKKTSHSVILDSTNYKSKFSFTYSYVRVSLVWLYLPKVATMQMYRRLISYSRHSEVS